MTRSHDEFASYTPAYIREWLADGSGKPAGCRVERQQGAMLFADLVGFTPLSQKLAQQGPDGAEELHRLLNLLYGRLVDVIYGHGGDIVAFAGDAAIAVWQTDQEEESPSPSDTGPNPVCREATLRAAAASLRLQEELHNYEFPGSEKLSIKVCLAYGEYFTSFIGGDRDLWQPFVGGPVMTQIRHAASGVLAGQVVLSPQVCELAAGAFIGVAAQDQNVILYELRKDHTPRPLHPAKLEEDTLPVLRSFVPEVVRTRLDAGQATWLADLRQLTVVFVSLQDFSVETDESVRRTHRATRIIQQAVRRREGALVQIVQDEKGVTAVLCFGLPPRIHEDDADRAVRAALDIQRRLSEQQIETSIGVATGRVFSGPRGSDLRREYAITGNLVNLAARLMGVKDTTIACDAATLRALRSTSCKPLPAVPLKGFSQPVPVFQPIETRAANAGAGTLTGRARELKVISTWLAVAEQGGQHAFIIEGDAGIGKSVLVSELQLQSHVSSMRVLQGECDAIERDTPYHTWRWLLAGLLDLKPEMSAEEQRQRVLDAFGFNPDLAKKASLLNDVLHLEIPEDPAVAELPGRARFDNLQNMVVQLLSEVTGQTQVLILLEDVHWLDASSWRLLAAVMRFTDFVSIAVSCRPHQVQPPEEFLQLCQQDWTTHLKLGPMEYQDVVQLACAQLDATSLSNELTELIWKRSQGNPFFAVELSGYLKDAGMLQHEDGEVCLKHGWNDGFDVPGSIRALVTARVDQLAAPQQLTLKVSSVLGQTFEEIALQSVHPQQQEASDVPRHLDNICEANLIEAERQLRGAFSFKHATIQEVTYDQIPGANRRAVHRAIAQWLEKKKGETSTSQQLLAFHWGRAGVFDKEIQYLSRAAESAIRNYSNREAASVLKLLTGRHESTVPEPTTGQKRQRAHWNRLLGEATFRLGDLAESEVQLELSLTLMSFKYPQSMSGLYANILWEVLVQAVHRAAPFAFTSPRDVAGEEERNGGRYEAALSFYRLGQIQYLTVNMPKGLYCALRVLNLSEPLGNSTLLARAYAAVGLVSGMLGFHPFARKYAELAERTARRIGHAATLSHLLMTVSVYHVGVGDWKLSGAMVDEAIAVATEVGDQTYLYESLSVAGVRAALIADYALAESHFRGVLEVASRTANELHEAVAYSGLGECSLRRGDLAAAEEQLLRAEKLLQQADYRTEEMRVFGLLTTTCYRLGDETRAAEYANLTMQCVEGSSFATVSTLEAFACFAEFYTLNFRKTPDDKKCQASAKLAVKSLKRYASLYVVGKPRLGITQALLKHAAGEQDRALRLLETALAEAHRLQMPLEEALAVFHLGLLEEDGPQRREHLTAAMEKLEQLGLMFELEQAQRALR